MTPVSADVLEMRPAPNAREERDTILVVEDDEIIRDMIRELLEFVLPEFKVVMAEHPVKAIDLLISGLAHKVAMIWTDNTMPRMKGGAFARVLKGENVEGKEIPRDTVSYLENVPVVMATGDNIEHIAELVQRGLLRTILQKPFSLEDVINIVAPIARKVRATG